MRQTDTYRHTQPDRHRQVQRQRQIQTDTIQREREDTRPGQAIPSNTIPERDM